MKMIPRLHQLVVCLVTMVLVACEPELPEGFVKTSTADTLLPVIVIAGQKSDTAYLYSTYRDPGASVFDDQDGIHSCLDYCSVSDVTGWVNTRLPGNYYLNYNYRSADGNLIATDTRTVYVKENASGFLNGFYSVTCTCSVMAQGAQQPTLSLVNYTATVSTGDVNNEFKLVSLRIGPEEIVPDAELNGSAIKLGYFSPDYHCASSLSGTLSPATTSFTIDSKFYHYSPSVVYTCKNIYKKQLVLDRLIGSIKSTNAR